MKLAIAAAAGAAVLASVSTVHAAGSGQHKMCYEVYRPVCATDKAGKRHTYSNDCFAKLAGATDIVVGPCSAAK